MNLTAWIIGWVVVTTIVVVLGYIRMTLGLHDVLDIHFSSSAGAGLTAEDAERGKKFKMIDRFGIPLTVISALMMIVIVVLWVIESAGGR